MNRILKLRKPNMPNFAGYEMPASKREDGINFDNNKFPITEFSREEAIEFGEPMKQTFIEHWESKQNKAKPEDYMRSNK